MNVSSSPHCHIKIIISGTKFSYKRHNIVSVMSAGVGSVLTPQ